MADVWGALDEVLERRVAVKILKPSLTTDPVVLARFRSEARLAARVNHPNVVAVYDTVSGDGCDALVQELVDGRTLRQELDDRPKLGIGETVRVGLAVADALAAVHAVGIVHRDVKPSNVLLATDGRVLLTDFGIATRGRQDLTSEDVMMGTAKYLSPEQVEGQPASARADLYSLGVVLYECLAGRAPFQADSDAAMALARLRADPIPLRTLRPGIPSRLATLVRACLARQPGERPRSAASLRDALTRLEPEVIEDDERASLGLRLDPERRRRRRGGDVTPTGATAPVPTGVPVAGEPPVAAAPPDARSPDAPGSPDAARSPDATGSPDAAGSPDATGSPDAARSPDAAGSPDAANSADAARAPAATRPSAGSQPPDPRRSGVGSQPPVASRPADATAPSAGDRPIRPARTGTPAADLDPGAAAATTDTPPIAAGATVGAGGAAPATGVAPSPDPAGGPADRSVPRSRRRWPWLAAAAITTTVVAVGVPWIGGRPAGDTGQAPPDAAATVSSEAGAQVTFTVTTTAPPVPVAPATGAGDGTTAPVVVITIGEFDPPPGDGRENPTMLRNLIDDNERTSWSSLCYDNAAMRPKDGVGLVFELSGSASGHALEVASTTRDWSASVFVSDARPPTVRAWGPAVSARRDITTPTVLFPLENATGRYVLLWITRLGASPVCKLPYDIRIDEVRLR